MALVSTESSVRRFRWMRADYDRVVEAGGFGPEDRIELLDGELWEMTPESGLHAAMCDKAMVVLQRVFGETALVRPGHPIALDGVSEPQPDLAVVRGTPNDQFAGHPSEALLVVEVSISSLAYDRGRKLRAYARNGVPEYWIIDPNGDVLEVYRQPEGERFASKSVLRRGDSLTPIHVPEATLNVSDLLPPQE